MAKEEKLKVLQEESFYKKFCEKFIVNDSDCDLKLTPNGFISEKFKKTKDGFDVVKKNIDSKKFFITGKIVNLQTSEISLKISYFKGTKEKDFIVLYKSTGSRKDLINEFRKYGFAVDSNNVNLYMSYITSFYKNNQDKLITIETVNKLGWHNREFIPYSSKYKIDVNDDLKDVISSVSTLGSEQKWIDFISKNRKNDIFRFYMSASYASVLLTPLNERSFVIHNFGMTASGKTAMGLLALSIWGEPTRAKIDHKSTSSFIEIFVSTRNNLPLLLDEKTNESDKFSKSQITDLIYMLGNGTSKGRATVNVGLKETKTWNCISFSNAEMQISESHMNEGVFNRLVELKGKPFSSSEEAKKVYKLVKDNYGHTGKKFIDEIKKYDLNELENKLDEFEKDLKNDFNLDIHIRNIAIICLADYLTSFIYGGSYEESLIFGKSILSLLIKKSDVNTSENACDEIMEFISKNKNNFNDNSVIKVGFLRNNLYHIFTGEVKKTLESSGYNYNKIRNYMIDNGYIEVDKNRQLVLVSHTRVFKILPTFFNRINQYDEYVSQEIIKVLPITEDDILNYLSRLNTSEFNKFHEKYDKIYDKKNSPNIFSEKSRANQGETVEKIIAENIENEIKTIDLMIKNSEWLESKGYDIEEYRSKLKNLNGNTDCFFNDYTANKTIGNIVKLLDYYSKEDTSRDVSTLKTF
jgi:hypothetical protein